ncbi:MAG: histidine--tRNA ligase [Phycisphaeraceae bacterium]|nr:MAG: histidine--tRNA ligase [Phycisphaeraceae bacterium]
MGLKCVIDRDAVSGSGACVTSAHRKTPSPTSPASFRIPDSRIRRLLSSHSEDTLRPMPPEDQKFPEPTPSGRHGKPFQAPRGARDFYPEDMARRQYIFDAWRKTALRHGFDEIDGPTFEHLDLYTVKSGEGIVNELFSFRRAGGETDFALRPEFTPTLARMVAAKANSLPKPIKWFSVGNFFRAERPQRGRLREFSQWNVDILGDESAEADAELIACCVGALEGFGLSSDQIRLRIGHRAAVESIFRRFEIAESNYGEWFALLDRKPKLEQAEYVNQAQRLGFDEKRMKELDAALDNATATTDDDLSSLASQLERTGVSAWTTIDLSIVRGLAYYTGMVFEVHETGGKERAIAGGGRYDNLVELFGGPPTPAVGFAMGDVVLSLVLQDRGLMPEGAELLDKIDARPDIFLISNGQEESEAALKPTVAELRRAGLHARHTHRTTRNVGKLLKEASSCHARYAVIIENAATCTLKNLETGEEKKDVPLDGLVVEMQG